MKNNNENNKLFGAREKFILFLLLTIAFSWLGVLYILNPGTPLVQFLLPVIALFLGTFCSIMPCCLPIIPGYLGILGKLGDKLSPTKIFLRFFTGLISIVIIIGLVVSFVGLGTSTVMTIKYLAGLVILIIGVDLLLSVLGLPTINLMKRMPGLSISSKNKGVFVQGMIYGSASTPCALLILTPILVFSLTIQNFWLNFTNFLLYAVGRSVPFLVITFMAEWKRKKIFGYLSKKGKKVKIIIAVLIIIAALGIFSEAVVQDPLHHLFSWSSPFHEHAQDPLLQLWDWITGGGAETHPHDPSIGPHEH